MRSITRRAHGIRPGADVAAVVERELVCQPVDMGLRTDEDEERSCRQPVALPGAGVLDDERLKRATVCTDQLANLGVTEDLYTWVALDLVGQIARHVPSQVAVADQQADLGGVLGQEQTCLPAELPPPTTATGAAWHSSASIWVAA